MKTLVTLLAIASLMPISGLVAAAPDGMPEKSLFGLCTAWTHNENGREHGNAENAPPFVWLAEQAEENDYDTVEEYCEAEVEHPGLP